MREQHVMTMDDVDGVSADHESGTPTLRIDTGVASSDVVRGVIEGLGYEMASR